jgi:hypothetical protein
MQHHQEAVMRLCEFEDRKVVYISRKPLITLRQLNKEKVRLHKLYAADEKRKPLIASMYGQDNGHEVQMQAIELERERVELAKDKAELANIRAEQGSKAALQIKKMSRSVMRQRKKV